MVDPEPLLAHVRAEHILAVVALLWPFVLTVCMAVLRWKRLQSRAGFLVLGVLACFGLQAFLARLARYVFWTYFAPLEPQSYSAAVHVTDPGVIIVASVLLSVPLLLWWAALMGRPPAADRPR
jgi:hypothetical protein